MPNFPAMKPFFLHVSVFALLALFCAPASAQSLASSPSDRSGNGQLDMLIKKVDEQSTKIDALSQQILKLEQQISSIRPGVMIGETTPAPAVAIPVATAAGNAHVVSKGETLTSIAKAARVGVQDLQKFNHIENDRALQIGQTIMIPNAAGSPAPSASASASAPNE